MRSWRILLTVPPDTPLNRTTAAWFGYPTYWANRSGARVDRLGVAADAEAADLAALEPFVGARA